jgi:hypothetical protein
MPLFYEYLTDMNLGTFKHRDGIPNTFDMRKWYIYTMCKKIKLRTRPNKWQRRKNQQQYSS